MRRTSNTKLSKFIDIAAQRPLNSKELNELNELTDLDRGFSATMGIRFTHVSNGEVRAMIHAGPQHHQPWGVVNGGVYCSLAETTASLAGVIAAGKPVMGINNDTNFIRAVSSGPVQAVASPVQLGSRTQVWEVEMTQGGKLMAKTTLRTLVV